MTPDPADAGQPQDMGGWQPIETAPKDGSTVLLAERTWGGDLVVTPGSYHEDYHGWWEHGSHPTDYADQPIDNPTHWMPLPMPPRGDTSHD